MGLSYKELYEKSQIKYNELLDKYNMIVNDNKYKEAVYETPFEFLRMLYLAKRIDFYSNANIGQKPVFEFISAQEALSTYNDLINFKDKTSNLLDKAALINHVSVLVDTINTYVKDSNFLDDNYLLYKDEKVSNIAKECLQVLPTVSKEITPELRISLLKDMLNSFEDKQIKGLISKNVFKVEDVEKIVPIISTEKGKKNLNILFDTFNLEMIPIISEKIRIKGTTFNNEDGSSRQNYLASLKEYMSKLDDSNIINLTLEKCKYKPEIGPEEPSVKVLWNDKLLGFLPRELAIQLHNEYNDKLISAKANQVLGGENVSFGLEITLDVNERVKEREELEEEK